MMRLFFLPLGCVAVFVCLLLGIHWVFVSGPAEDAAAARSRAVEARAVADAKDADAEKATADAKSAEFAVDFEEKRGNNEVNLVNAKALAFVATSAVTKDSGWSAGELQLACVAFFSVAMGFWFKWSRAEKRADDAEKWAERLELVLITGGGQKFIEQARTPVMVSGRRGGRLIEGRV